MTLKRNRKLEKYGGEKNKNKINIIEQMHFDLADLRNPHRQ